MLDPNENECEGEDSMARRVQLYARSFLSFTCQFQRCACWILTCLSYSWLIFISLVKILTPLNSEGKDIDESVYRIIIYASISGCLHVHSHSISPWFLELISWVVKVTASKLCLVSLGLRLLTFDYTLVPQVNDLKKLINEPAIKSYALIYCLLDLKEKRRNN